VEWTEWSGVEWNGVEWSGEELETHFLEFPRRVQGADFQRAISHAYCTSRDVLQYLQCLA
jgi:hypothetical protein